MVMLKQRKTDNAHRSAQDASKSTWESGCFEGGWLYSAAPGAPAYTRTDV